jgi:hypothetical protein
MITFTQTGYNKFFDATFNFTDIDRVKLGFLASDHITLASEARTAAEDWSGSASDLALLSSPTMQVFKDLTVEPNESFTFRQSGSTTSRTGYRGLKLKTSGINLSNDFILDTSGYAVVIDVVDNICLGYVKVLPGNKLTFNQPGVENTWENGIIGGLTMTELYNYSILEKLATGIEFDINNVQWSVFTADMSVDNAYGNYRYTATMTTTGYNNRGFTLVAQSPVNNFRQEDRKFTFDDQFIDLPDNTYEDLFLALTTIPTDASQIGDIIAVVDKNSIILDATGGAFIKAGSNGFFSF